MENPKSGRDVQIQTADLDAAAHFYEFVLGLPVSYRSDGLVGLETGSFCLYVERGPGHGPIFEFLVADLDSTKAKLLAAGCRIIEEDPAIPRCYIRDPYGLVFNLARKKA